MPIYEESICAILERQQEWVDSNKKVGRDCTEDESAQVKMFLKEYFAEPNSDDEQIIRDIQLYLPCEYGEAVDEFETKS